MLMMNAVNKIYSDIQMTKTELMAAIVNNNEMNDYTFSVKKVNSHGKNCQVYLSEIEINKDTYVIDGERAELKMAGFLTEADLSVIVTASSGSIGKSGKIQGLAVVTPKGSFSIIDNKRFIKSEKKLSSIRRHMMNESQAEYKPTRLKGRECQKELLVNGANGYDCLWKFNNKANRTKCLDYFCELVACLVHLGVDSIS